MSKEEALDAYSKDGKWNARVAQQAVRIYKARGGKYKKRSQETSLQKWTDEHWMYHPSDANKTGRYLPQKVWKQLTKQQVRKTNEAKRTSSKKRVPWESFVTAAFHKI